MNNIDIANGIIFQRMGIKKDSFDDRLLCQKKVYLLQSLGIDLGYTYNWYVRGPYSPSLTNYIYSNLDVLSSNDFSKYKLSEAAEKSIGQVNILAIERKEDMGLASWYELLASLLYIDKNRQSWNIDGQDVSLFCTLMKQKPKYNAEQCQYAYGVLRKRGFVKAGA